MIIARPLGIIRSAFFFSAFMVSRIPLWFIIISAFVTGCISPMQVVSIMAATVICRSYIESEIAGNGFLLFTALRIFRFFTWVFMFVAMYGIFFYYALVAEPIDKMLIALSFIIIIYLYDGFKKKDGYWNGYKTPLRVTVITSLLWLYLAFVPDSLFGNISILVAIYIIEFVNLTDGIPLQGLGRQKN